MPNPEPTAAAYIGRHTINVCPCITRSKCYKTINVCPCITLSKCYKTIIFRKYSIVKWHIYKSKTIDILRNFLLKYIQFRKFSSEHLLNEILY